jgi:integrase
LAKVLTATGIAKLQPSHKRQEIPDGGCRGLKLIIQPSGAKSFALRFRRPDGKTAKMTLGPFDAMNELEGEPIIGAPLTLAAARRLASDLQRQRALGRDVISDHRSTKRSRKADFEQRSTQNFAAVAQRFVAEYARPRLRSWRVSAQLLGLTRDGLGLAPGGLAERWSSKLVSEITPGDVDDLIAEIRTRGTPGLKRRIALSDSAARVALLRYSKFFSWCREKRLIAISPCDAVSRPPRGPSRERTLSDDEIKLLWLACGQLGEPFGPLLKLLLVSGQRKNECARMTWAEVQGDVWHLPSDRAKNGRAHVVPLTPLALKQIHTVKRIGTTYIFTTTGDVPVGGWSKVKRRLDLKMAKLAGAEIAPFTIHDLRRTTATGLQKLGIRLEITEAVLNHSSGSFRGVVGIYQRHTYSEEKRAALNLWSDYVEKLVSSPQ